MIKKYLLWLIPILTILLCIGALIFLFQSHQKTIAKKEEVPIKELASISYKNVSNDLVTVSLPMPGTIQGRTILVTGKARGQWYFEASFPITLLDEKGGTLATTIAQAKSDWMTTDFVPYEAVITVPNYKGKATLLLKKDNPSGLPENDASISFPIIIE